LNIRQRAVQAGSILNNDVFKEALTIAEASLITEWKACENKDQRDVYWYKVNSLYSVVDSLKAFVDSDKIENKDKE
jgi:hypothetical protein